MLQSLGSKRVGHDLVIEEEEQQQLGLDFLLERSEPGVCAQEGLSTQASPFLFGPETIHDRSREDCLSLP